jgi:hypothetical protein
MILAMLVVHCVKVMKVMNTRQIKIRRGDEERSEKVPRCGKRGMGEWENGRMGEENLLYLYGIAAKLKIMEIIRSHKELVVYQMAYKSSMELSHLTKSFPKEEVYSLTSQIRRSSRSVSANLAKAFRKRRYEKAFVSKLSDCEAEAAGKLVIMMKSPGKWSQ